MDTLAELHERHDAVKEIERKLVELHEVSAWQIVAILYIAGKSIPKLIFNPFFSI